MFDKFGEFDSAEELNKAAAGMKAEGDEESLVALALENGIDKEDAEDYMGGCVDQLATPLMAAVGKVKVEAEKLKMEGILEDWKNAVTDLCVEDPDMQDAVRRKGKSICECMAELIKFAFEDKKKVSDEIVKACKVVHNGKTEPLRGPLYLGIPNRAEVKRIVKEYYLGKKA